MMYLLTAIGVLFGWVHLKIESPGLPQSSTRAISFPLQDAYAYSYLRNVGETIVEIVQIFPL